MLITETVQEIYHVFALNRPDVDQERLKVWSVNHFIMDFFCSVCQKRHCAVVPICLFLNLFSLSFIHYSIKLIFSFI